MLVASGIAQHSAAPSPRARVRCALACPHRAVQPVLACSISPLAHLHGFAALAAAPVCLSVCLVAVLNERCIGAIVSPCMSTHARRRFRPVLVLLLQCRQGQREPRLNSPLLRALSVFEDARLRRPCSLRTNETPFAARESVRCVVARSISTVGPLSASVLLAVAPSIPGWANMPIGIAQSESFASRRH